MMIEVLPTSGLYSSALLYCMSFVYVVSFNSHFASAGADSGSAFGSSHAYVAGVACSCKGEPGLAGGAAEQKTAPFRASQLADKVEGAVAATNLGILVCDAKYKETIHSVVQSWYQMKPEYDANSTEQPDHPWCEKKLFTFATVLEVLSGEYKDSEAGKALTELQNFQTEELARWVAACRPRFAHPKENRP